MWISKKEYEKLKWNEERLMKDNRILREKMQNYEIGENQSRKAMRELRDEKQRLEEALKTQKITLNNITKDNTILLTNNQVLLEWINKIINEVGVYNVETRQTIRIPIYKNPIRAIGGRYEDVIKEIPNFLKQEEIIIPEIKFITMKGGRE